MARRVEGRAKRPAQRPTFDGVREAKEFLRVVSAFVAYCDALARRSVDDQRARILVADQVMTLCASQVVFHLLELSCGAGMPDAPDIARAMGALRAVTESSLDRVERDLPDILREFSQELSRGTMH